MRSASSTASRTECSLAAISVMKPRLTPRLSRCPVPSTVRPPSSSGRAMIALTLGAGPYQHRQVGHLVDRYAVQDHAMIVNQDQLTLVLPQRRWGALDDVDDQRIGQPARDTCVLDPAIAEQPPANLRHVDQ